MSSFECVCCKNEPSSPVRSRLNSRSGSCSSEHSSTDSNGRQGIVSLDLTTSLASSGVRNSDEEMNAVWRICHEVRTVHLSSSKGLTAYYCIFGVVGCLEQSLKILLD